MYMTVRNPDHKLTSLYVKPTPFLPFVHTNIDANNPTTQQLACKQTKRLLLGGSCYGEVKFGLKYSYVCAERETL